MTLRTQGLVDPKQDGFIDAERKPLTAHLDDYRHDLESRNITTSYVDETLGQIRRVIKLAQADQISELKPALVQQAIALIRGKEWGGSIRTCNKHLIAIKGFSKWLHRNRLTREDALATLSTDNADKDPRHQRRDISDDDLHRLFESTKEHDIAGGMTGTDRTALYWLAAGTGFRRNELRSLTPASFELDAHPPTVIVQASVTKSGRTDAQPIRDDLAEALRPWLATKSADEPVFANMPQNVARMLRWDLKRAGIPYSLDGKIFDFHALRGVYISRIERSGATIKTFQTLARHTDPRLSLKRYVRIRMDDSLAALERLPSPRPRKPQQQAQRATGTDGGHIEHERTSKHTDILAASKHQQFPQQSVHETVQPSAKRCDKTHERLIATDNHNTLVFSGDNDAVRQRARGNEEYPLRDRLSLI